MLLKALPMIEYCFACCTGSTAGCSYTMHVTGSFLVKAKSSCASLQPCFVFVGDGFDSNPELKMAKSLLLDFFRGRQIDAINLKVQLDSDTSQGA